MKRKLFTMSVPVALAIGLIGCGGSSSNQPLPSLYMGSWSGTWNSPGLNVSSQAMTLTVTADGSASGTMVRSSGSGTVAGSINNIGALTAATSYTASGNYIIGGTVTSANGHLVGSMVISYLGVDYMGTFDLAPGGSSSTTGGTAGA